jgi:electron transfer flavoprotein alpha/beta subunit
LDDSSLLRRSTQLRRVLVSQDDDLLLVGAQFQRSGTAFTGLVYAHQLQITIGQFVEDLDLIAKATDSDDWDRKIEYLPLR